MKLIDKDALVAVIERRKNLCEKIALDSRNQENKDYYQGKAELCKETIDHLDTLEVKEVDLEKEMDLVEDKYRGFESLSRADVIAVAKHFFQLGLNASNPLTWEDIKEMCVQSVLVEIDLDGTVSDERHYTEVLKRFKERKGK